MAKKNMRAVKTAAVAGMAMAMSAAVSAPAAFAGHHETDGAKMEHPCKANPCAAKHPCKAHNPCAAKNPCAAAHPCKAHNPCAAKNPCKAD